MDKIKWYYYIPFNVLYGFYAYTDKFGTVYNDRIRASYITSLFYYINILNIVELVISLIKQKNTYWLGIIHPIFLLLGLLAFMIVNDLLYGRSKNYQVIYDNYFANTTKNKRILYGILTPIYFAFSFISLLYKPWLIWK